MNLRNLLLAMIFIMLTSFVTLKPRDSVIHATNIKSLSHFETNSVSGSVESFECNEFEWEALKDYTIEQMERGFGNTLTCIQEPVINAFNPDITDTIYSYSDNTNEIRIYKARENSFVLTFTVTDSLFKLNGNIQPGMNKDDFASIFNISKPLENTVIIKDSDDTIAFQFFFDNNRLVQITSEIYLD